jgi:ABC-type multidrug transport system ATPase subunit
MLNFSPTFRRSASAHTAALAARQLAKRYGRRTVFARLDLTLSPGSATWLTGPSGIGKTTLLRCLAGAERFDSGTVEVAGYSLLERPLSGRHRIGYAPAQLHLLPYLSPIEHLHLWAGLSASEAEDVLRGARMIDDLAFYDQRHERVRTLPPDARQQLSLVGALQNSPDLLLVDVPDDAMAPADALPCRGYLESYRLSGGAILFTSGLPGLVDQLATDELDLGAHVERVRSRHG